MKTQSMLIRTLIGVFLVFSATACTHDMAYVPSEKFVHKASQVNRFEIESSRLALRKSQDREVKTFARMMIDDHNKSAKSLKSTLANTNLGLQPTVVLNDKYQSKINDLEATSGREFDREYIAMQTRTHMKAVNLFRNYAENGENAALRNYAAKTLPTLEKHLQHVEQLESKY